MKKSFVRIITAVILASTLLSLISCGSKYELPESSEEELETVLRVGDYEVPFELYRYFFMNYKRTYDEGDESHWDKLGEAESFSMLDGLARDSITRIYATLALALDYKIDYKSGAVQREVIKTIEEYIDMECDGDMEIYKKDLEGAFMNSSVFRFVMAEFECESRLFDALVDEGKIVTDDETIMNAITGGEFCHAKQILIMNNDEDDPEENRRIAEEVLAKAQAGDDFDRLVAEYGEDTEMITSPVGYYFTHGELIEEFEEAAFALEIGELSPIVESPLGYHIILRCELDPMYVAQNFEDLAEAYKTSKFYFAVNEKIETLTVTEAERWRSLSMNDFKY